MPTTLEDCVLKPNRAKIRALRKAKGWSLDDAFVAARNMRLGMSKNTLRTLELDGAPAGCYLSTLGAVLRLYGLPRSALLDLVEDDAEPEAAPPPPPRRSRANRSA